MNYDDSFKIIYSAGSAKTEMLSALKAARKNDYVEAERLLQQGQLLLKDAYTIHQEMLSMIADGKVVDVDAIMMHAQDHLMSTTTIQLLVEELIEMYKTIREEIK